MISVTIKRSQTTAKTFDIEIIIPNPLKENLQIQLPAWRPGRYELQNFAKNVSKFEAVNKNNQLVKNSKITKDSWLLDASLEDEIIIRYCYYANQMDAGGSYITPSMIYINFINCIFYVNNRLEEAYEVNIEVPTHYTIACGLDQIHHGKLIATSFYELVDCPFIGSEKLSLETYEVEKTNFNIWIEGNSTIDPTTLKRDFQKFTQEQFNLFKSFPFKEYHFIFILLPYAHYHGVEHHNSTIIVLGPDYNMHKPELYNELLGISCHELFHAWNALKIKPAELSPYDFTKENYFETGYMIEGLTTYYGDYLLGRSGVWTIEQFIATLNTTLKREFDNFGNLNSSLSRSSVELWLDGYVQGIPNRKVSIYTKGCLVALLVDLKIRAITHNQKSLDDVMFELWTQFGQTNKGYSGKDFISIINQLTGIQLDNEISHYIDHADPLHESLNHALSWIGCKLEISNSKSNTEALLGFRVTEKDGKTTVDFCDPNSNAAKTLAKGDELIAINGKKINHNIQHLVSLHPTINITLFRDFELMNITLDINDNRYFKQYEITAIETCSNLQKESFRLWANI